MTGWLEIAGAIGIVIPYTSRAASIGLALLLIAMFPANVYASRKGIGIAGKRATPLFVRTVLQVVFIAAVLTAGFLEE